MRLYPVNRARKYLYFLVSELSLNKSDNAITTRRERDRRKALLVEF